MSYPRNNASPERIAIGPVVLIADGTVQVADVLVKVIPQGAVAAAGGGTISYEEGIVGYIPTQAETNHTSFQLIAYKANCIPAGVTVVTSAAAVAGQVVTDTTSREASKATGFSTYAGTDTAGTTELLTRVVGTILAGNHAPSSGDSFARLGAPVGVSISADIAAITAGSGLDAAGVRAAIGMAAADMDTQLGDIKATVDLLVPGDPVNIHAETTIIRAG